MAVYIDSVRIPYRGMLMCHMVADTHDELMAMAKHLKLLPQWIQHEGTTREHFDVSWGKRAEAIKLGAIPVTIRQLAQVIRSKQ